MSSAVAERLGKKVIEAKEKNAHIRESKKQLMQHMINNNIPKINTSSGAVFVLKENKTKPPLNVKLLRKLLHKGYSDQEAEEIMKFIDDERNLLRTSKYSLSVSTPGN